MRRGGRLERAALHRVGARAPWRRIAALAVALVLTCLLGTAAGRDRADELEGLRDEIQKSRERVTEHEADERALLEQLEEVDRRLQEAWRERSAAREVVAAARGRLDAVEPLLTRARAELSSTQRALAARAVALYRGGEIGTVRVLFSATSLSDLLSRANALRRLVQHDAGLVARHVEERDRLAALQAESRAALAERETADARLTRVVARLRVEREGKGAILTRVQGDRTKERQLLLELEQAAKALEETIRTLGARSGRMSAGVAGAGFAARKGALSPPVRAGIRDRFGPVIDPEFQTTTFRSGIDFAADAGAPVRSVAVGVVRFAGWFRGYGRIVIVDHGGAFHTVSGHLDEIHVTVDDPVEEGQTLGTVGETGSLAGASLYFELRRGAEPLDPEPWLRGN